MIVLNRSKLIILVKLLLSLVIFVKCDNTKIQPCIFEYNSSLISQGEVYSPNYPNPYPTNLNCRYEFFGRENERVILQIDDFQLESPQATSMQEANLMDLIETVTRPGGPASNDHKLINNKKEADSLNALDHLKSNKNGDELNLNKNLYSNKQCFYDFLDVFSIDALGRLYWRSRHCGTKIESQIVSTSPSLILVFKSDRMLSYRGFKFRFHFSYINILPFVTDSICGPNEIKSDGGAGGGVLTSPNYPDMFPGQTECAWTITVQKHQNILLKFIDVNLNQPCHISHVSIWDGYVSDPYKADFVVCEKLIYYHKGILSYKSKTNRLVIKFAGNKDIEKNNNIIKDETVSSSADHINNQNNNNNNAAMSSQNAHKINRTMRTRPGSLNRIKYGFYLSWTAVHLNDTTCNQNEFKCKGGEYCIDSKNVLCQTTYEYCINKELLCDGVYNCDLGKFIKIIFIIETELSYVYYAFRNLRSVSASLKINPKRVTYKIGSVFKII
jgi:hypothetical protein